MKDPIEGEYEKLAPEKRDAIDGMLATSIGEDFFLLPMIDGPPGTGKTHTATIGGSMYVRQNPEENKVILTAFTNFALDRIKEELDRWFPPSEVVRLTPNPAEKDWVRGRIGCDYQLANLSWEEIRRIGEKPFLICTPFMLGRLGDYPLLRKWKRAMVIFDEFSQIDAPTFFMALGHLKKALPKGIVLFGDPLQLPVVTTQQDLYPNIVNFLGGLRSFEPYRLVMQFRMHDQICDAVNRMRRELSRFTPVSSGHELISDESVKERDLTELGYTWKPEEARKYGSKYEQILDPSYPLVLIDTSDLGFDRQSSITGSWYNEGEAELARNIAIAASGSIVKTSAGQPEFPKVITPYTAQSRLLKQNLPKESVLTVYRAQGREYPLVIVSMVRNNERGDVGFLDMPYLRGQGYVALSRAMGKMVVLMAHDTFIAHPVFEAVLRMREEECLKMKLRL